MRERNFLIKMLWQHVHTKWVCIQVREQLNLGKNLVSERATHYERWVPSCTSKVDKSTFCQHNHGVTVWECPEVSSGLQFITGSTATSKASHINFIVEVADVAHDCVVLHLGHVFGSDDCFVTCCSYENICFSQS